jgi:phage terminase large subunit-like protein
MAGNQLGKTLAGAFEMAMHLTGEYPEWWTGRTFDRSIRVLAGSETAEMTRKGVQRLLVGPPEQEAEWGTGAVPKDAIVSWNRRMGVPNTLDNIVVRHKSGRDSVLEFKSYDQGRAKWQADTVDLVWFDEEPDEDVYTEGLTRTNATGGGVYMTFTPLLGMSTVVKRFLLEKSHDRHITTMTIDDAEHYTPEQRETIVAGYPEHEREARAKGIPTLGSGRVFPVTEESIREPQPSIPAHWSRICGLDIGWDHPTAAVWLAWDRDSDTVHVYDCYRVKEQTPVIHAAAINSRGKWIPVAWPHDGLQHDKGSGVPIAQQYRDHGANLLPEKATFPDGSNGVEAGVLDMLDRMKTGRLKVAEHLNDWWEEFRLYHRKDGQIVKEGDDLMSATRYAVMMLRFAAVNRTMDALINYRMPGVV